MRKGPLSFWQGAFPFSSAGRMTWRPGTLWDASAITQGWPFRLLLDAIAHLPAILARQTPEARYVLACSNRDPYDILSDRLLELSVCALSPRLQGLAGFCRKPGVCGGLRKGRP